MFLQMTVHVFKAKTRICPKRTPISYNLSDMNETMNIHCAYLLRIQISNFFHKITSAFFLQSGDLQKKYVETK